MLRGVKMFQNVYRDYTEEKDEINIKSSNRVIDFSSYYNGTHPKGLTHGK